MPTPVEIWNTALSHIGARADIQDPNEQSSEAFQCRLHYQQTVDELLERSDWSFARRRADLSRIGDADGLLDSRYALPADALSIRAINDTELWPGARVGWSIEGEGSARVLRTDQNPAAVVYTARVGEALFPPSFVTALAWALAAKIAMPITRDAKHMQRAAEQAVVTLSDAKALDANQRGVRTEHTPDWIRARGNEDASELWPYESIHGYLARP
jgi:hypothetical protein